MALFSFNIAHAVTCAPDEIHVREQNISSYIKKDGTHVHAHTREAHCRTIKITNYFQDKTDQSFKNLKPHIKPWATNEKKVFESYLAKCPEWLKKYRLIEVLRASFDDSNKNPAASIPKSKTLILYDAFFTASNKTDIITHELAHFAFHDLADSETRDFYVTSGWTVIERPIKSLDHL